VALRDLDAIGDERVEAWHFRGGHDPNDVADVDRIIDDVKWGRNISQLWYTLPDPSGLLLVYTRGSVLVAVDYMTGDPTTFSVRFVGDETELGEAGDIFI
jgi:hypothetical protein